VADPKSVKSAATAKALPSFLVGENDKQLWEDVEKL
jgi:hypothetical protein